MGCFLSCFRARPDDPSGDLRDPLVRRDPGIGDAFLDDGGDDAKLRANGALKGCCGNGGGMDYEEEEELRREANYLRSCGTISETPPEIREVSSKIFSEETNEVIKGTLVSEDNLSEGFNCDERGTLSHEQNIDENIGHHLGFESVPRSSLEDRSSCQNMNNQQLDSSDSPYPTPLVLRHDMYTPGTIHTAYKGNLGSGKPTRTSRQFVYPVLRPIENKLQWAELRYHYSFHANTAKQDEAASPEETKNQSGNQQLLDGGELLKNNSDYGKHGVSSLSCWLKPSSADNESHCDTYGNIEKQPCYDKGDFMDVPIFAASGLNWECDNPTPVLPKAWDGNGIPNTTTKYKEDQKVSWHSTPFEERLLKVLSDEKPHHQRKISGKLIQLDEETE